MPTEIGRAIAPDGGCQGRARSESESRTAFPSRPDGPGVFGIAGRVTQVVAVGIDLLQLALQAFETLDQRIVCHNDVASRNGTAPGILRRGFHPPVPCPDFVEFGLHLRHAAKLKVEGAVDPVDDPPALIQEFDEGIVFTPRHIMARRFRDARQTFPTPFLS